MALSLSNADSAYERHCLEKHEKVAENIDEKVSDPSGTNRACYV